MILGALLLPIWCSQGRSTAATAICMPHGMAAAIGHSKCPLLGGVFLYDAYPSTSALLSTWTAHMRSTHLEGGWVWETVVVIPGNWHLIPGQFNGANIYLLNIKCPSARRGVAAAAAAVALSLVIYPSTRMLIKSCPRDTRTLLGGGGHGGSCHEIQSSSTGLDD